ncbi:MAG TPA: transposase, partial [Phycisphaerales bacterium]|nr:transposase [Phycisphaerales bacterium]
LNGDDVARVLDQIRSTRGVLPKKIRVDNGAEFASKRLDQWAYLNKIHPDFSRSGKPTDNGLIEAFNGRLRAECLSENWFLSLTDAQEKVGAWRMHENTEQPHSALGSLALRLVQKWVQAHPADTKSATPLNVWGCPGVYRIAYHTPQQNQERERRDGLQTAPPGTTSSSDGPRSTSRWIAAP